VDDPLAKTVLVAGSVTMDQLRALLSGFPGLTVTDRSGFSAVQAAQQQTSTEVNLVFMGLIIVFTAIGSPSVETLHYAELSHVLRVFSFHVAQSFDATSTKCPDSPTAGGAAPPGASRFSELIAMAGSADSAPGHPPRLGRCRLTHPSLPGAAEWSPWSR
jgi:hypothetical protein